MSFDLSEKSLLDHAQSAVKAAPFRRAAWRPVHRIRNGYPYLYSGTMIDLIGWQKGVDQRALHIKWTPFGIHNPNHLAVRANYAPMIDTIIKGKAI